jgi:hypothetical protein
MIDYLAGSTGNASVKDLSTLATSLPSGGMYQGRVLDAALFKAASKGIDAVEELIRNFPSQVRMEDMARHIGVIGLTNFEAGFKDLDRLPLSSNRRAALEKLILATQMSAMKSGQVSAVSKEILNRAISDPIPWKREVALAAVLPELAKDELYDVKNLMKSLQPGIRTDKCVGQVIGRRIKAGDDCISWAEWIDENRHLVRTETLNEFFRNWQQKSPYEFNRFTGNLNAEIGGSKNSFVLKAAQDWLSARKSK